MRLHRLRSIISIITAAAVAFSVFLSGGGVTRLQAEDSSGNSKVINVVYDDSRSMYWDGLTRWCQAKYALEVFAAMLGDDDVMNVHSMNRQEVLKIKGSDKNRVKKVHEMTSKYWGTPFNTVTAAGDALIKDKSDGEKWLVVLTDGEFQEVPSGTTLQKTLEKYNDKGAKTVYLGIGDEAADLKSDTAKGMYAEKAATTEEILTKVTSIANQIFEHQVLTDRHIQKSGTSVTLDIDIPTDEIVIFAQGKDAAVGELRYNGKTIKPENTFTVRHSGDVMPLNPDDLKMIKVDESLHGIVVIFNSGSMPYESGKYSVDISGADKVEYYFRPGVKVNCSLIQDGNIVPPNSTGLASGTYTAKMNFIHPVTGEVIKSDLLDDAAFAMSAENNGSTFDIDGTEGEIKLGKGEVNIKATAFLPGNVVLTNTKTYNVMQAMKVELAEVPSAYSQDQMIGKDVKPIRLRIVDSETGEAISEEAVSKMQLVIDDGLGDKSGIKWTYEKAEDGTWEIYPRSADGMMKGIYPGSRQVSVSASYENGNESGAGNISFPLSVIEYSGSSLNISFGDEQSYDLNNYLIGEPMKVTITYVNPVTGVEEPITEDMWNKLHLDTSCVRANGKKARLGWNVKKGDSPGVYLIKPTCFLKVCSVLSSSGEHVLTLGTSTKSGEYRFSGSASQNVNIIPLTLLNLLIRIGIIIIILIFIWGHLRKPRIKTRGRNFSPVCILTDGSMDPPVSARRKIKKDFVTVVWPFGPEKATVRCASAQYGCTAGPMRIEAVTNSSFRITSNLPVASIKISSRRFKNNDELHKMIFNYGSFKLDNLDRNARTTGRFQFTKPKKRQTNRNRSAGRKKTGKRRR